MKKLLTILSLCALGLTLLTCVGCTEDDNNLALSNHDKKLQAVTKEVKAKKTTDKALLLVSFGSTWDKPQQTFKKIQARFKEQFPDRDLYFAFTSEICMTRCAQKGWNYYAPKFYLEALGVAGYKDIAVQSLHIVPGEEFLRIQNCIKDFRNDGDHPEFAKTTVYLAGPLLETEEDCKTVAAELHKIYGKEVAAGKLVSFMGHGNPENMNYGRGNSRYPKIEEELQKLSPNYFVATVDMEGNLVENLIARAKKAGKTKGTMLLHPLMSIAGDHANNDLKGGVDPQNPEEGSWRYEMNKAGFKCTLDGCTMNGLADYPAIVNVWVSHMKKALAGEPLYTPEEDEK